MPYKYKAILCVRVCVFIFYWSIVVIQSLSHVQLFSTPWLEAHQGPLSFTISQSLLKLVHRVGDAIQPSHPLLSPSPPAFHLSQHQGLFQ